MHVSLGSRSYPILFQPLDSIAIHLNNAQLTSKKLVVITDQHLAELYLPTLVSALENAGKEVHSLVLPAGEETKQFKYLQQIYDFVLSIGIDRKTPIIALGGGVIGDLSGFAAASLLRGLPFVQIPTTLVAQVDSAVGGKTGINHVSGKNLIGAFHQPKFVLSDTQMLHSLPQREWVGGLAEAVKHALIADVVLFEEMAENWTAILDRTYPKLAELVEKSVAVKVKVVSQDETEQGIRAFLNFGHTFGHAIETVTQYKRFIHGEAVFLGMIAALHLSQNRYTQVDFTKALQLLRQVPIQPTTKDLALASLMKATEQDKKVLNGTLRFIALPQIGEAIILSDVQKQEAEAAFKFALSIS